MALENFKNENAIIRIGDGGTSMFIPGKNWQEFLPRLYDGHNADGEIVDGMICLKHSTLGNELFFSTLFRELEELVEIKQNGEKVYKKILRKGFCKKLYESIKKEHRTCATFEKLFWDMLKSEYALEYPTDGNYTVELYLDVSKPVCKRKVNCNYADQISVVVNIEGARIVKTTA